MVLSQQQRQLQKRGGVLKQDSALTKALVLNPIVQDRPDGNDSDSDSEVDAAAVKRELKRKRKRVVQQQAQKKAKQAKKAAAKANQPDAGSTEKLGPKERNQAKKARQKANRAQRAEKEEKEETTVPDNAAKKIAKKLRQKEKLRARRAAGVPSSKAKDKQ